MRLVRNGMSVLPRVWFRASGLFTLLLVLITFTPFVSWYARRLATSWNDPDGDILIVLAGGALESEGFPAEDTMLRCLYGVRAYRAGHFRQVIVAGFQTSRFMRNLLACDGVPGGIIEVEGASRSTRENALRTAALLRGVSGRVVLLTSDYHMYRAARAFHKAGLQVLEYPIPDAGKRGVWPQKRCMVFADEVLETVKILYYRARGWI